MRIRVEFKPQDCWIGVFWRRTVERRVHRPKEGRALVVACPHLDVWICVIPMLPLHITRLGKETRESFDCASTALEMAIAGVDVEAHGWIRHARSDDSPNADD